MKAKTGIVKGIGDCINTWHIKKGMSEISLLESKTALIKQIDHKNVKLKNNIVTL